MKTILSAIIFSLCIFASCQKCVEKPVDDCIDRTKINNDAMCIQVWDPVCGCDGKTYSNDCHAGNAGVKSWKPGECGSR